MKNTNKFLAIGLMSGTSLDGVDAALLETDGENHIKFIADFYLPYDADFRQKMQSCAKTDIPLNEVLRLEKQLTEYHAEAVAGLLNKARKENNAVYTPPHSSGVGELQNSQISAKNIAVLGFHGQTIRHLPDEGLTWQLGNASLLAELTGIPVVGDFRRRDMAVGGQGAPLVPLFHQALFAQQPKPLMVLNIGGVANFTYISPNNEDTVAGEIYAGDTGTGMGLMDAYMLKTTGDFYDKDGQLASQGVVDKTTVDKALSLAYFAKAFPKSADRYEFDAIDVSHLKPADAMATLCAVTVEAVAKSVENFPQKPQTLWVCGGGAKNPVIMKMLENKMSQIEKSKQNFPKIRNVEEINLRTDSMEAECFAWLAVRRLKKLPFSTPNTTACQKVSCGGILTV